MQAEVEGQTPGGPQTRPGRPDTVQGELQRQYEMQVIEKALNAERARRTQRFPPLILQQIKSDFLGIQVIDRKLLQAISTPGKVDLEVVLKSTSEIRKLTQRLKKNLSLPHAETIERSKVTVESTIESIGQAVPVLSRLIEDLVSNPMFEQSKLIDSRLSAKAQRDLDSIIELSGDIRNSTQKLQRTKL
jgi:hypothetical protein